VRRNLDQYTLAALEDSANSPTEVPLLESVLAFLERRSGMLETLDAQPMGHTKTLVSRDNNCKICNIGSHRPLSCNMFRRMDPDNRTQAITKIEGCANSLSNYHKTNSCPSPMPCRFCRRRHHSMLHKHPESTAPVVAIATRDQPLQAMDGCFRSKSANPNDQQGVCVGPRP